MEFNAPFNFSDCYISPLQYCGAGTIKDKVTRTKHSKLEWILVYGGGVRIKLITVRQAIGLLLERQLLQAG